MLVPVHSSAEMAKAHLFLKHLPGSRTRFYLARAARFVHTDTFASGVLGKSQSHPFTGFSHRCLLSAIRFLGYSWGYEGIPCVFCLPGSPTCSRQTRRESGGHRRGECDNVVTVSSLVPRESQSLLTLRQSPFNTVHLGKNTSWNIKIIIKRHRKEKLASLEVLMCNEWLTMLLFVFFLHPRCLRILLS